MAKIIGVSKFERLFREAAGLDVDKNDLARLNDFVRQKVYDLLLAAQATAKDNQRDVIQLHDLPLTLGFKERGLRSALCRDSVRNGYALSRCVAPRCRKPTHEPPICARSVPKAALARPLPTCQTRKKGRLNFLYPLQSHLRGDFGLVLFNQNVFKFPIAVSWYFELKATNG